MSFCLENKRLGVQVLNYLN